MLNKIFLNLLSPFYANAIDSVYNLSVCSSLDLESYVKNKLNLLLSHAIQNVPFYSGYYKNEKNPKLHNFPIMEKNIIKQSKDLLLAKNLAAARLKHNSTSGSTGESFFFYSDSLRDVYRDAFANLGEQWAGAELSDPKLIIWGADRDVLKTPSFKRRVAHSSFLFNYRLLSSYHMTNNDIAGFINDHYEKFKPNVLIGYPSTLELIAEFVNRENIRLKHKVRGVITSGETLLEHQRIVIENRFGAKIFNRYGCREVGPIAHECSEHNGLHIFSPHVHVEILDMENKPCPPGVIGEIVVTDLDNFAFPFIRYRIGDLGVFSEKKCKCGCNFPLLEAVQGRVFDSIVGINGNRVPGNFFTLLRTKIEGVEKFQVLQKNKRRVEIKVIPNSEFSQEQEVKMLHLMKEKLGEEMIIEVSRVTHIPVTKSGKFRFIVSEVSAFE